MERVAALKQIEFELKVNPVVAMLGQGSVVKQQQQSSILIV